MTTTILRTPVLDRPVTLPLPAWRSNGGPQDILAGAAAPATPDAHLRKMALQLASPPTLSVHGGGGHGPHPQPPGTDPGPSPAPDPTPSPDPTMTAYARVKGTVTDSDGNEVSTLDGVAVEKGGQTQYSDTFSTGDFGSDTLAGAQVDEQYSVNGTPDSQTSYSVTTTDDGVTHLIGQRLSPQGDKYEAVAVDITPTQTGCHVEVTENPLDGKSSVTHTVGDVVLSQNSSGGQVADVKAAETVDGNTVQIAAQVNNSDKKPVNLIPVLVGLLS